ncbi:MAG: hypothetical protein ACOC4M_05250 [Promethearchaeia archaeon]
MQTPIIQPMMMEGDDLPYNLLQKKYVLSRKIISLHFRPKPLYKKKDKC